MWRYACASPTRPRPSAASRGLQHGRLCAGGRRGDARQDRAVGGGPGIPRRLELCAADGCGAGHCGRVVGAGACPRRQCAPAVGQCGRVPAGLSGRDLGGLGTDSHLVAADRGRDHENGGHGRTEADRGRRRDRPAHAPALRRPGGRCASFAGAGSGRGTDLGRSGTRGLCDFHLRHLGQSARGAARPSRDLGTADDVAGLVWPRPRGPAHARGRLQLDLYAGHRPHGPVERGCHSADPGSRHDSRRSGRDAARRGRDDLCRRPGGLPPDAEGRSWPVGCAAPRADGGRKARSPDPHGLGGSDGHHAPRSLWHVGMFDLRLRQPRAPRARGQPWLSAGRAACGGDRRRRDRGPGHARRACHPPRRSRADAGLYGCQGRDRRALRG